MKKSLKISALLFATLFTVVGCGNANGIPSPTKPVVEEEPKYVSNTLHDVIINKTGVPFIVDGQSDYKFIYDGESALAKKAVLFVRYHIYIATGCNLDYEEYSSGMTYNPYSKYIVFNIPQLAEEAGVSKTTKNIDVTGYQITSKDNSVFMFINHEYGYQQVAYAFLTYVIGYDRISKDTVLYTKDGSILPTMDIVERPDYQIRTQSNKVDIDYSYETGFLVSNEVFFNGTVEETTVKFVHNCFDWIPLSHRKNHPKWFSNDAASQLCYTANGDAKEYQALVDESVRRLEIALENDKECTRFSYTIEDNHGGCTCDACKANTDKYGATSSSIILFLNDVDTYIQEYLQNQADEYNAKLPGAVKEGDAKPQGGTYSKEEAIAYNRLLVGAREKRKMEIVFFAYNKVEQPPVKELPDGTYVPTYPEMICHDSVSVYIAPISAKYTESFYSDANYSARATIEGWSVICKSINYWLYETNFSEYLYPYDTFGTMANTYRYTVDKNASYLYNEGQHNNGATTCFGRFKEYFNQKMEINVNTNYQELVNHFFEEYFGDASDIMYQYFYELQEYSRYIHEQYSGEIVGDIYEQISKAKYWPKNLLDKWLGYINDAYSVINRYRFTDYNYYKKLKDHINLESVFLRYALIEHHSGKYDSATLHQMQSDLYYEATDLGVSQVREGTKFSDLKQLWGV